MYHFKKDGFSWFENYEREEPDVFRFGKEDIQVRYKFLKSAVEAYVDDDDLRKYFPKKKFLDKNNPNEVLNYFYQSKEFRKFLQIFENCLKKIMKKYKGFPSVLHQTKVFIIEFRDKGTLSVYHKENEFHTIDLAFNIKRLWYSDRTNSADISHELYHVISSFHEGEQVQAKKLRRWEEKLFKAVSSNREDVNRWLQVCEKDLGSGMNPLQHVNLDYFYDNCKRIYWNTIIDTALNIIVLKLEDEEYIQHELDYDWSHELHEEDFQALNKITNEIKSNPNLDDKKRKFLLNLQILMQFVKGYISMPINIIPYALIDDFWHPKKRFFLLFKEKRYHEVAIAHINRFEEHIKKYFEPEAVHAFFKFWKHYKEMTKHMNIRIDPLNPAVTREIHNAESLHSAKEGYKLLNRLFYDLYKRVKEFE